jgi:hypothetical protein
MYLVYGAILNLSGDLLGLLHGCCTMLRLLHQHKVWDDQHLTCCLEANYSSFVQGIFSESMITQKFGGCTALRPVVALGANRFP